MAARIAGAIMFGKISKCPSCGGGNPRLFFDKLTFICPGYMDDDHFRHCKKHFKVGKI